jgi:hypothetical protein
VELFPDSDKKPVKWYLKPVSIFIAIIGFGPFAIPLIWASPALKRWQKIALTLITALLTLWMVKAFLEMYRILLKEMLNLQDVLR